MDRWVGKIAMVTGASSGIGEVIARDLANRGIIVVAVARRLDKLENLAKSTTGKIHPMKCDIQVESDILSVFRWTEETLGGVDILVNNAGVLNFSSLMDEETNKWREMWNVNVIGLSICTREALKTMRKRGDNGHIFHINSIAGHIVPHFKGIACGIYSATKHAVTTLTEALRLELMDAKSNIRVTSISPGLVSSDMAAYVFQEFQKVSIQKSLDIDPKKILSADDISEAVMYVLGTKPYVQVQDIIIRPVREG